MQFRGIAFQKKKAIAWAMAFFDFSRSVAYGRLALSSASDTANPVAIAVTPIAVIMK